MPGLCFRRREKMNVILIKVGSIQRITANSINHCSKWTAQLTQVINHVLLNTF